AAVADGLAARNRAPIVLDPVMVAKSGASLLAMEAVAALRTRLLPLATVITPNLPEAGVLLDRPPPATLADMREAARALQRL
ncbi:bifunctional hydroxymethylpyrimidine kinase/phosphomethylpyrimidine kinase, partial [Acinetobacter baumannii]